MLSSWELGEISCSLQFFEEPLCKHAGSQSDPAEWIRGRYSLPNQTDSLASLWDCDILVFSVEERELLRWLEFCLRVIFMNLSFIPSHYLKLWNEHIFNFKHIFFWFLSFSCRFSRLLPLTPAHADAQISTGEWQKLFFLQFFCYPLPSVVISKQSLYEYYMNTDRFLTSNMVTLSSYWANEWIVLFQNLKSDCKTGICVLKYGEAKMMIGEYIIFSPYTSNHHRNPKCYAFCNRLRD